MSVVAAILAVLGLFVVAFIVKMVNAIVLKPKWQESVLRKQGINGTTFQLWGGERARLSQLKVNGISSMPKTLSHDILSCSHPIESHLMEKYGKMFFYWTGTVPRIVLMEPKLIREMLTNKSGEFQKPAINGFTRLFVAGVSSLNGDKWAMHRKLLNPAFHMAKLQGMVPSILKCTQGMISAWEGILRAKDSCEIDVFAEFQKLTADIISNVAFGSNYEEGSKVFQLMNEQSKLLNKVYYMAAFPFLRHLPTKTNARMKYIQKEVTSALKDIIQKRQRIMKKDGIVKDDLLGLMLQSNLNSQLVGKGMTLQELIDECKLFYFAGHETTANSLTWAIVALSMHQDWQEKARDEVFKQVGREHTPTFDDLGRLKTVTMVLQETLRLYPPSSIIRTTGQKGAKLGDKQLPGGAHVFIPTPCVHRDQEVWGKDVLEFNPSRFSEGVSKASDKDSAPYFPFGWGPRVCIGQNLSMLEAKMALSMLLQRYTFELSPSYTHAPSFMLTLEPFHGAPVIIRRL
ncbi:cytochrome P450 CYP72A219-like [Chenopodium quinoa]|uniref:cytochrome P450 CYP72A219-like n=1 Tax=Chenopodium quinoa TaxID=63459 RepID=UPI000B78BC7D|nr:cytochrome P450 CYP72A219-like [Chenopodium quinoa]